MKVWTNYKRRSEAEKFKEVFTLPSLTDELDDEPIINILNRFVAHGGTLPNMDGQVNVSDLTSSEAVDEAFSSLEGSETSELSKVEQAEVLATAQQFVEQLQAQQAKQSEKSAISKPETQSAEASATADMVEGKNEK